MFRSVVWRDMTVMARDLNTGISVESRTGRERRALFDKQRAINNDSQGFCKEAFCQTRFSIYFDTEPNRFRFSSPSFPLHKTFYRFAYCGKISKTLPHLLPAQPLRSIYHRMMGNSLVCHRTRSRQYV